MEALHLTLPRSVLELTSKVTPRPSRLLVDENRITIANEDTSWTSPTLEGAFPNVADMISGIDASTFMTCAREHAVAALERLDIFGKEADVALTLDRGSVSCRASVPGDESVATDHFKATGSLPRKANFSLGFLLEALRAETGDEVVIESGDGGGVFRLTSTAMTQFLMPRRARAG